MNRMRTPRFARRTGIAAVAATLCLGLAMATALPAEAVTRSTNRTTTVIFVHGIQIDATPLDAGVDCSTNWTTAIAAFKTAGWAASSLKTYGYYNKDSNCDLWGSDSSNNSVHRANDYTSIKDLGRELAWRIYNNYTSKGLKVDIVAHSMGGLIVRSALTEVDKKNSAYPKALWVEDVVTLGTPHAGALATAWCVLLPSACLSVTEVREMIPGSSFLSGLESRPAGAVPADWTVVGSTKDLVVGGASALAMNAQHSLLISGSTAPGHSGLKTDKTALKAATDGAYLGTA